MQKPENQNDKNKRGAEEMAKVYPEETLKKRKNLENLNISREAIEKLAKKKVPIKIKDGILQLDKNHPDYDYWMED